MIVHHWGLIEYLQASTKMIEIHSTALKDGQDHLILCSHPKVFTVGSDNKMDWEVPTIQSDRGGSITCHSEGQAVFYFCFQVPQPVKFYRTILAAFDHFFQETLPTARYDKAYPGYYINNQKIASLGFRYRQGVSLHGMALNVAVDLDFHSLVNPCGLTGITPTSLRNEGVDMNLKQVNHIIVQNIAEAFDEKIHTAL